MTTTYSELSPRTFLPLSRPKTPPKPFDRDALVLFLVVAVALVLAVVRYAQFHEEHRQLWWSATHDRNAHYYFSIKLAADLKHGHIGQWLEDVNGSRVWPPLQDILASAALLVGGLDDRLAIWPSLAGWVLALIFGFLVARRIAPRGGTLAGALAMLFIAASPAHRAFSTDVMLESLGAGLTLVVLYCYLVAVQDDTDRISAGRWLGLCLTILFVQKYNYWLLVFLAVMGTEVLVWRRELAWAVRAFLGSSAWRNWFRSQVRIVSNYVLLAVLGVVAFVYAHGDRPLVWNGRELSVYPPYNIVQIAYWIVFVRLLMWWRTAGKDWVGTLDGRLQQIVRWHFWPAAWWMALPKHVGPFLWFLSPANATPGARPSFLNGLHAYRSWAAADYHLSLACLVVAATFLVLGLFALPWARRGGAAVGVFFLLALFLTVSHPNQQARFLTTWITTGWVLAGVGMAALVFGPVTARLSKLRPALACAALAGIGVVQAFGDWSIRVPNAGTHPELPNLLDVSNSYLPDLAGKQQVTILSSVSIGPLAQWTFFERYGRLDRLEDHRFAFGPTGAPNRQAFRAWLQTTTVETIVFIEALPGPLVQTPWEEISETPLHAQVREELNEQSVFALTRRQEFPRHGCAVTLWKRVGK